MFKILCTWSLQLLMLFFACFPLVGGRFFYFNHLILSSQSCYSCTIGLNGESNGTALQYSCLENPMDGGAWWAAVRGVAESWTRQSDFTFTFHFHALEKEMATHSSVLAWRIPGTVEPNGLPSMGSHRVRHDWSDLAAAAYIYLYPLPLDFLPVEVTLSY